MKNACGPEVHPTPSYLRHPPRSDRSPLVAYAPRARHAHVLQMFVTAVTSRVQHEEPRRRRQGSCWGLVMSNAICACHTVHALTVLRAGAPLPVVMGRLFLSGEKAVINSRGEVIVDTGTLEMRTLGMLLSYPELHCMYSTGVVVQGR